MRVVSTSTAQAFACAAADWIGAHLHHSPQPVLALPTGNTPLGLYAELIARSNAGSLNLKTARIFNLDEFIGVTRLDPHSYAAFLERHLFAPLQLDAAQIRLLQGDAADLQAECRAYDLAIKKCGGIDLCILGLGVNGHIGFNEPGSEWDTRTHVVQLSPATRAAQKQDDSWNIPAWGITMGIKTMLEARRVLLLIAGDGKDAARRAFYGGTADRTWPVTSLLAHPDLTAIELSATAPPP